MAKTWKRFLKIFVASLIGFLLPIVISLPVLYIMGAGGVFFGFYVLGVAFIAGIIAGILAFKHNQSQNDH